MDSGAGIVHSERPSDELAVEQGGLLEIFQFWINTPAAHKMDAPGTRESTAAWDESGWCIDLVQGEWDDQHSPIEAHHPMRIANLSSDQPGATLHLPVPPDWVGVLYVLDGNATINGQSITGRQMALISAGAAESIELVCTDAVRILP